MLRPNIFSLPNHTYCWKTSRIFIGGFGSLAQYLAVFPTPKYCLPTLSLFSYPRHNAAFHSKRGYPPPPSYRTQQVRGMEVVGVLSYSDDLATASGNQAISTVSWTNYFRHRTGAQWW